MSDHYFIEPILAKCSDRSQLSPQNAVVGGPEDWFANVPGVSFDFFVDWTTRRIDSELWVKRPVNREVVHDIDAATDAEIMQMLREDARFVEVVFFARANSLTASAIIFNDDQDWTAPEALLIKATWPLDAAAGFGLRIERLLRSEIEDLIRLQSGGPVKIGTKGLTYGTSRLECFLSHTTAAWPGDVDFILCDEMRNPRAILEFKKHTAGTELSLNEQCLANYYPHKDARKYDRLALLSEQLSDSRIPFYVIYYSVVGGCLDVYVEPLSGAPGRLVGGQPVHIRMDPANLQSSISKLVSCL